MSLPVISNMLDRNMAQISSAIPSNIGLTPERFKRLALTAYNKNPLVRECDPVSICAAIMDAAQMGLEFGELKHCALVPYKNYKTGKSECKLMVQYQGLLALLWRGQTIEDVCARVVYEDDVFEVDYGTSVKWAHRPTFRSSKPRLYYAAATPKGGNAMIEIMTVEQVEAHAKQYARGIDKKDSPWNTDFDAMAKKTVLRRLIKLLPLSADSPISIAARKDEEVWEADQTENRMDKFKALHAAPDVPTEAELQAALKSYENASETAKKMKIDISDLQLGESRDIQRIFALTDSIGFRCESHEVSAGEPKNE